MLGYTNIPRTIELAFIKLNNFKSSFKILQWLPVALKMELNVFARLREF